MKIVLIVSLIVASIVVRSVQAAESGPGSALPQTQRVILKWLGTAGWEIQFAQTKILIDPSLHASRWPGEKNGKLTKRLF